MISTISNFNITTISPAITKTLYSLPEELLALVFSYLENQELQLITTLNKQYNFLLKKAINDESYRCINLFIKEIKSQLPPNSTQLIALNAIDTQSIQNSLNLIDLKNSILTTRSSLTTLIKTVDIDIIAHLMGTFNTPLRFMDDILYRSATEKIALESDPIIKSKAFAAISQAFCKRGDFDRAVNTTFLIPVESIRLKTSQELNNSLLEKGQIRTALYFTSTIPFHIRSLGIFEDLASFLIKNNKFDEAFVLLSLIQDYTLASTLHENLNSQKFNEIFSDLYDNFNPDSELMLTTPNQSLYTDLDSGNITTLSKEIPFEPASSQALSQAVLIILAKNRNDLDPALEIAKRIFNKELRAYSLGAVFQTAVSDLPVSQAISMAKSISSDSIRYEAMTLLSLILAVYQQFEASIDLVKELSATSEDPWELFQNLSNLLTTINRFEEAERIAREIPTTEQARWDCFSAISIKIIHDNETDLDEANRLIQEIPDGNYAKNEALEEISNLESSDTDSTGTSD